MSDFHPERVTVLRPAAVRTIVPIVRGGEIEEAVQGVESDWPHHTHEDLDEDRPRRNDHGTLVSPLVHHPWLFYSNISR